VLRAAAELALLLDDYGPERKRGTSYMENLRLKKYYMPPVNWLLIEEALEKFGDKKAPPGPQTGRSRPDLEH
jgi:hypothetical protein